MDPNAPGAICIDCVVRDPELLRQANEGVPSGHFCEHWRPEYWEARGYVRNWGDAAVMNWPHMEILRREHRTDQMDEISFIILAPNLLRRPLLIDAHAGPDTRLRAWGAY